MDCVCGRCCSTESRQRKNMRKLKLLVAFVLSIALIAVKPADSPAIGQTPYVSNVASGGSFTLAAGKTTATIYVDANDWPGVIRAAGDLQSDVRRVTDLTPTLVKDDKALGANMVLIGTVGKSAIIDRLAREKKID